MGQANENPMKRRNAFTLVELLVAITIFVILTVLTLGAFNLNIGSERVRSASRQIQAMLEGAKTRAYKFQKPVGVRFLLGDSFLDTKSPVEITGMMYVTGQSNPADGASYETGFLRYVDLDGDATNGSVIEGIQFAKWYAGNNPSIEWEQLFSRGNLIAGVKIRIPAKTGKWYRVASDEFMPDLPGSHNDNNPDESDETDDWYDFTTMRLTEALLDVNNWGLTQAGFGDNKSKTVPYELDLSTVMGPMSGEDPVSLPNGIVVDLKSSKVPSNWNVSRWRPGVTYSVGDWVVGNSNAGVRVFRADNAGDTHTDMNNEPAWPSAVNSIVVGTGTPPITWRCYELPRFDIVFTPQGTVMGSVVAEGLLHLTLAETRDTHAIFENDQTTSPVGQTTIGVPVWDLRDHNGDGEMPEHIGSFRVITVFPASGSVNVSPIDQSDTDNNGFADSIFRYAIEGSTAK